MRLLAPLLAALALAAPASAASPAAGQWKTANGGAVIEVFDCAGKLCGRVLTSDKLAADPDLTDARNPDPALRSRPGKGMVIVQGFEGGPAEWRGGSVYDPQTGKTYKGSLKLSSPDQLKLTGCIVFPLCRTETWIRAK